MTEPRGPVRQCGALVGCAGLTSLASMTTGCLEVAFGSFAMDPDLSGFPGFLKSGLGTWIRLLPSMAPGISVTELVGLCV